MDACEGCHRWGYTRWRATRTALRMEYVGNITADPTTATVVDSLVLVKQ